MIPLSQLPPDPHPDLTLVRLADLKFNPTLSVFRAVQHHCPGRQVVFLAEVVERDVDGDPRLVRILQ